MVLQNRVRPDGEIIAVSDRGLFMGNRGGKLHDPASKTLLKTQSSWQWICCVLEFKNRQRTVMGDGYTELFFLDEVTALAAGHRPCFECRRADALSFRDVWQAADGLSKPPSAPEMDKVLAGERRGRRGLKLTWQARAGDLPNGTMVRLDGAMFAVAEQRLLPWSAGGYGTPVRLSPGQDVEVLTPTAITRILRNGYEPVWHSSASRTIWKDKGQHT